AGARFQTALGATSLDAMRDAPPDRILAAQAAVGLRPVYDGKVLTRPGQDVFAAHAQNDVPIMIGFTANEGFGPIAAANTVATYEAAVRQVYGANAERVLRLFPAHTDDEAPHAANRLARDATLGVPVHNWAQAQARFG